MKKFILFICLGLLYAELQSQPTTIGYEPFSSTLSGWTIVNSSSATWTRDTNYYLSNPSCYQGDVPSSSHVGDSITLISPVYDVSQYPNVFLRFSHICKVSATDICQVSIKENHAGSRWKVIPSSCYRGTSSNYNKGNKFNDASYIDWRSDSLWLQPTNTWWKTESFDISSEASFSSVQFKFTIIKGATVGSEFAAGWFIDNFELLASMYQIDPPVVQFSPPLVIDTVNHIGPFTILAKVATRTNLPIIRPKLEIVYTYGSILTYDTLLMNNVAGDSIWIAVIPQTLFSTDIQYTIHASDSVGNKSFATSGFYVKRIGIGDSNSVAMTSIDYPSELVVGGQLTPVVATFTNKGLKGLDSCVLYWSVNGVLQPSHTWRGHIADAHSAQDTLGYYSPRQNTYDTIVVWVGLPNGVVDTINHDDTVHIYTYGCITILSGVYIVGTNSGSDFMSINNVISALGGCGSSGNVILKLQSQTFVENVSLLNLKSLLGPNDTLTITSQTGKAKDAIIKPVNGCGITIGKSDNIIIKNISIDVSSATSVISHGIYFIDTCSNIWIDSCIIIAKNGIDTGYDCIHQLNKTTALGSGLLNNLYITNNTITNGYHGIYLFGSTNKFRNTNVNICNNTISAFSMGMMLWGTNFEKINNNYITRNTTTARWCHGIFFTYASGKEICNNRIYMSGVGGAPSTGWTSGGIIGYSGNAPEGFSATDRLLMANNEVIITAANVTARGIYCSSGPRFTDFMHNSVLMLGSAGTTSDAPMCFDIVNGVGATSIANIYNNNFVNLSGTITGTKNYAMRIPASNTYFIRDYNNYYSIGQYPVATRSAGYTSIKAWVSAFYLDSNSVSVLPDTITALSTHLRIEGSQILCPALSQVPYDINQTQRIVTTNMGCHHTNVPNTYDAGIAALSFSRTFADSVYPTVLVSVLDMGSHVLDSVEIHWSVNGIAQPTYIWHGALPRGQKSPNVNIGNFMVRKGINNIVVYTSSPNGQSIDENHDNDTAFYQEFACGLPLVGTYTVGSITADFTDEKEMMRAITDCGIGGSVVFEFLSGTYGDLNFSAYPLPSISMDSITITSAAHHADSVVFMSSDMAALSIGNIAHFIFEKVTFDATTKGYYAIKFMKPMNNIKFYECNIYANPTATTTDYAGVYYLGLSGNINDISFIKNKISGGYYNLYLNTSGANRFILDSNELTNAAGAGIYCEQATHFSSISYNRIISRLNTTSNYYGVHLYFRGNIDTMVCNKIHITTTANAYGLNLYMQFNYALGVPAFVANNELILNGATCYGINGNTTGSSGAVYAQVNYLHNSIYVKGNTVYGIYLLEYGGTNDGKIYRATFKYNNIYASSISGRNAYAYYIVGTVATQYYTIDYNNYYSTDSNLVYINNTNCTSIAAIVAADSTKDSNSINVNPMYPYSPVNLSPSAMLQCPLVPYVKYDITHDLRTVSNNAMGCYAKFFTLDAGLDTFYMPLPISLTGTQTNVRVRLLNYGIDTLHDAKIQWTLNNVLQTPFTINNLSLKQYGDTVVTIGSFIPLQIGSIHIKVWSECIGDGNTFNDTISMTTYVCDSMLSGSYTIGSNNRDFANINDALTALSNCGVAGPVIFLVDAGTYEQINISKIYSGANDTNIVTFTSASGNANDVKIVSSSTAVLLFQAGYLNFNHLTIDASSDSTKAAVQIMFSADNIEFSNCIIKAAVLKDNLEHYQMGAIHSDNITTTVNNLRILHNTINGGHYNIYLQASKNQSAYGTGIIINHNVLTNAFYASIRTSFANVSSISYNQITSQTSSTKGFIGISLQYSNVYINANKIRALSTLQSFTGIELTYVNSNASSNGLLSNNEIIASTTSANNFGIAVNQSTYVNIINNSIFLNSSNAKCLYINNATASIVLKNNNFISAATAYPIYLGSISYAQSSVMDYNNYYSGGNYIGYAGSGVSNMATWQALTTKDQHSVSIFPSFVNINTDLSLTNSNNNGLICPIDSSVTSDMNDSLRVLYTYMGAYTATVFDGNDLEMLSVIEPINTQDIVCYQNYASIKVALKNQGGYLIDFANNNLKLCVRVSGAISFQKDTLITVGTIGILQSDTFEITDFLPVSLNGTYHITAWLESDIDQVKTNDTVIADYTVNLLLLPYNENFSVSPSTFTFKQLSGNSGWSFRQGNGSNPVINPIYGTGCLAFASELGAIASARLQPLNLLGALNPELEFWYAHDNNNSTKDDKLFIRISVDGGMTYQSLSEIKRYNNAYTTPTFVHYTFDLSNYAMYSCVIIDFYGQSYGGGMQNIDSLSITAERDMEVNSIFMPKELIACELDSITMNVVIQNNTGQTMYFDNDSIFLHMNITKGTTQTYQLLLSGSLDGYAKDTISINHLNFMQGGQYNLVAYVDNFDNNTVNDTAKLILLINPDVSISEVIGIDDVTCKYSGDSIYVGVKIINTGNLTVNEIPIRLRINGANDIAEILSIRLEAGDSTIYSFNKPYIVPTVSHTQPYYLLSVQTELSCDNNNNNNVKTIMACVNIMDLELTSIDNPTVSPCDSGLKTVYVHLTLSNLGNQDIDAAIVHVEVDSAGEIIATITDTTLAISADAIQTHIFTKGYIVPNMDENYVVRAYFDKILRDGNTQNDTMSVNACAIYNDVSIEDLKTVHWSMGQNIPNPAQTTISIPYVIPQSGQIIFKVMTVSGQILHIEANDATFGSHSLELNTEGLCNGIYFYSMEYQGKRIIRKMTIQK